jgi:hypothetical protein
MVSQSFTAGGNRLYLEFWTITGCPRYLGYITQIVAPEPSVELVAGADHSMVGITGTHMVLWTLPRDSTMRLWGKSLHDLHWESCGGAHRVEPQGCI